MRRVYRYYGRLLTQALPELRLFSRDAGGAAAKAADALAAAAGAGRESLLAEVRALAAAVLPMHATELSTVQPAGAAAAAAAPLAPPRVCATPLDPPAVNSRSRKFTVQSPGEGRFSCLAMLVQSPKAPDARAVPDRKTATAHEIMISDTCRYLLQCRRVQGYWVEIQRAYKGQRGVGPAT